MVKQTNNSNQNISQCQSVLLFWFLLNFDFHQLVPHKFWGFDWGTFVVHHIIGKEQEVSWDNISPESNRGPGFMGLIIKWGARYMFVCTRPCEEESPASSCLARHIRILSILLLVSFNRLKRSRWLLGQASAMCICAVFRLQLVLELLLENRRPLRRIKGLFSLVIGYQTY